MEMDGNIVYVNGGAWWSIVDLKTKHVCTWASKNENEKSIHIKNIIYIWIVYFTSYFRDLKITSLKYFWNNSKKALLKKIIMGSFVVCHWKMQVVAKYDKNVCWIEAWIYKKLHNRKYKVDW